MKKTKTSRAKIINNTKWANKNKDRVKQYKTKYKSKNKKLARELVQDIKTKNKCKYCKESRFYCLDFHHKKPSNKKDTVSNLVRQGYAIKTILAEIKKCDIICSNCHRKQHCNEYPYLTKKAKYVLEIKQQSKCTKCGESNTECLDFHHIDDSKKTEGIGAMLRDTKYTLDMVKLEINKCVVLCSNCHREEHYKITPEGFEPPT